MSGLCASCAICKKSMRYGNVVRVQPCNHLVHRNCLQPVLRDATDARCPVCEQAVDGTTPVERKKYKNYIEQDRERIVAAALRGDDWATMAEDFDVPKQTAWGWVNTGRTHAKPRGKNCHKKLSPEQIATLMSWVEEAHGRVQLRALSERVEAEFGVRLSTATISNYLGSKYSPRVRLQMRTLHKMALSLGEDAAAAAGAVSPSSASSSSEAVEAPPASPDPVDPLDFDCHPLKLEFTS